ncbi:MAG: AlpA family phage regulatory protein [Pseudohongiella sp.]|nr:AlpA family phage regulatory protein [Pseudohongiella sp.]
MIIDNVPQKPLPRVWASDSQLAEIFSVTRATIWRWSASGRLPKPVRLSPGCTRWKIADIAQLQEGVA